MLSSGGTISRRVEGWRCFIWRTCHRRACRARTSTFTTLTSSVSFAPTHPPVPGHVTGSPHVRTSIRVATRPPAGRPRSLCVTGVLLQLCRAGDVEDDWCCGEGKRRLALAPAGWSEIISQICHEKILVAGCHSFVFPNIQDQWMSICDMETRLVPKYSKQAPCYPGSEETLQQRHSTPHPCNLATSGAAPPSADG